MTAKKQKPVKRVKAGTSIAAAADKRFAFVEAWFANGGNALQAAIAAGYSEKTAGVTGAKMLKDPRVAAEISKRRAEICTNLELNTEKTLREVGRLAFGDPRNVMNDDGTFKRLNELDDATAATIASYEVDKDGCIKYKFWDKNSALEKAAKINDLYAPQKVAHSGSVDLITQILEGMDGQDNGLPSR